MAERFSTPVSLAPGAVAALLALGIALDVLGGDPAASVQLGERPPDPHVTARRRSSLRRVIRGRDWDRRAPDAPDEPADLVWGRERRRRGLR